MDYDPISSVLAIPDLLYNFLLRLDYDSILNYCRSYKQARNVCNNEMFWAQKALQDFGVAVPEFNSPYNMNLRPIQRYLRYLTLYKKGISIGSEKYMSADYVAKKALEEGKDYIVQDLINKGYNNWNYLLELYASRNDRVTVNRISKLVNQNLMYQLVAQGALRGNHEDLFKLIFSLAPIGYQWNKDELLKAVSWGGNPQLLDAIINGISGFTYINMADLLTGPIYTNNAELFRSILNYVPPVMIDWNKLLGQASDANNLEIFNFIVSQVPANYYYNLNWNEFGRIAISRNNTRLFDRIRELASPDYNWDWQWVAENALDSKLNTNIKGLFDYVRSQAPSNYNWNWNNLLNKTGYNPELTQYIKSLMPLQ